jgi:hypothetical protein
MKQFARYVLLALVGVVAAVLFFVFSERSGPPAIEKKDSPEQVLLREDFSGDNRLLLTSPVRPEYCADGRDKWQVTNGSLFIHDGAGYSGVPTERQSKTTCPTPGDGGSYRFRMHSAETFTDGRLSLDYKLAARGEGKVYSYDGLHLWIRHESEHALYAVSIGRWDGRFVIKKKLPLTEQKCADPSNEGCYSELAPPVVRPGLITADAWRHAEVRTYGTDDGLAITLYIDGQKILDVIDDGRTAGRIIPRGAIGIRGDNTEFYIKNVRFIRY